MSAPTESERASCPVEPNAAPNIRSEATQDGWFLKDWITGLILFLATALVVMWQNSRLAIFWDLSYVLENSYRISLGDLPYRDFPFPYAPLTFLVQAAVIKGLCRSYLHHVLDCAFVRGSGTGLTWRLILNLFSRVRND